MDFISDIVTRHEGNVALVFGGCVLLGVWAAVLSSRYKWMPTITAFMLLGFVAGPHGIGMISAVTLKKSAVLIEIALGLILYKLGTMLHPQAMWRSRRLQVIALAEVLLSYALVLAGGLWLGLKPVVAAMVAAIGVSSSPAVLVHVAEELHAKGPVSDRAKSLVAVNNLLSFLLFSATLPFAMAGAKGGLLTVVGLPLYRLAGAVIAGIVVAWLAERVARLLTHGDNHYRFAIVIGAVMLTLGVCQTLGASALLSPLVLGIAVRFFETRANPLSKTPLGEGGDLFFIVLFVMAGAKIDPMALLALGLVPVVIVVLRSFAKIVGVTSAGYAYGVSLRDSLAASYMIIPMAGMAIGLANSAVKFAPATGQTVATIVFAMVAIFETIGPFVVTHGLQMVDETGKAAPEHEETPPNY